MDPADRAGVEGYRRRVVVERSSVVPEVPVESVPQGGSRLLPRARRLFAGFVALALVVSLLELTGDAVEVVPHVVVAVAAMGGLIAWAGWLLRRGHATVVADLASAALLVALGWGFQRPHGILFAMLAALMLRGAYGSRPSAARGAAAVVGAFLTLEVVLRGSERLLQIGTLNVVVASVAVAVVLRALAELLAARDLEASWDAVLTAASVALVGARDDGAVAAVRADAERQLEARTAGALEVDPPRTAADARLDAQVALATQRLRSEDRSRLLTERSHDGIYLLEIAPQVRYRYLNPAGAQLLGVPAERLVADPAVDREVVHPDDHAELRRRRAAQRVLVDPIGVRVGGGDRPLRWLELEERELPPEGPGGSVRLVLGTLRDVTERRRQEAALRTALERERTAADQLREVDALKTTFLRAVSHELRTPLAAVVGATETLRRRWPELTPAQIDTLTEVADRRARQLERLLADLLDVDRLASGALEPRRSAVAVRTLVTNVVADHLDGDHPTRVLGDEVIVGLDASAVERIVDNLVRNAHTHTPPGTPVDLTVRRVADGAELTVEDAGPGIAPEDRERLFEPFAQGDDSGDRSQPGTGIGLALVRRLAVLHGGDVHVEEGARGGARFVVTLPGPHLTDPATSHPSTWASAARAAEVSALRSKREVVDLAPVTPLQPRATGADGPPRGSSS